MCSVCLQSAVPAFCKQTSNIWNKCWKIWKYLSTTESKITEQVHKYRVNSEGTRTQQNLPYVQMLAVSRVSSSTKKRCSLLTLTGHITACIMSMLPAFDFLISAFFSFCVRASGSSECLLNIALLQTFYGALMWQSGKNQQCLH